MTTSLYITYPVSWIVTFTAHRICFAVVRKKLAKVWGVSGTTGSKVKPPPVRPDAERTGQCMNGVIAETYRVEIWRYQNGKSHTWNDGYYGK